MLSDVHLYSLYWTADRVSPPKVIQYVVLYTQYVKFLSFTGILAPYFTSLQVSFKTEIC